MGFSTDSIHAGQPNDPTTGAVSFPIYQTSTFEQNAPGVTKGYSYARTEHPTRQALERSIAALEGARHGVCLASGLAAVNTVLNLLSAGDHVVTCRDLYGGSYRLFTKVYQKFGVAFSFIDATDPAAIAAALRPNTKLLWLESPSNPLLLVTDLAAAAAVARKHGVLTVVDNTFATPYLQRPLALGADLVVHSTTKYLNGHSDVIGGAIVTNDDKLAEQLHFFQNAVGAIPGPQDCFLTLRGIKTLSLRMERHCANARRVAEFLRRHPKIEKVYFPGLAEHPGHAIARQQMKDFGGMVSCVLRTDEAGARRFAADLEIFTLAESLGTVKSLVAHPPSMTHASVEPEVRRQNGIPDGLIRLSIGCEDAEDLIRDLEQALAKVPAEVPAARPQPAQVRG
jgi:cystathionine beta-lyase/cystathionine gamma-synthase